MSKLDCTHTRYASTQIWVLSSPFVHQAVSGFSMSRHSWDNINRQASRFCTPESVRLNRKTIWSDRGFVKYLREYFLVFQIVTAASGTFIYSEDRNNEVVLKHTLGEKVTKIADLGTGNFEYVSNTKRTLEIIRPVVHKPLFKAFRFKKSWEPEILG